ncbi:uncharacterized protein J4E78_008261 [Alternaria triticimaculans]|uniref:uncharacterized protein n=1 Tax=Alternaria triticimaculans TaxID=297637 RepID=UPI0020C35419|nr:uncharacterized protein J4E78_008261 [Alternaria triticimaculans]KAI4649980.1 hypothetical protein J4E78_008261 [Alternaria triticimaculans]
MATTQQNKDQYSTSEIELSFANSKERIRHESRISTDAPQLELLHHNERDAANSDDRSSRERVPSTALNDELPNAPLLEKQSDLSLGWPTSPRPVKNSFNFPENAEFLYVVPSPWLWLPDYELFKPTLDSSYLAALMSQTTTQGSQRDTWGHVKVPRIEHYESTSPLGDGGWYSTENSTLESYSSFIGVPISGMNSPEFIDYSTTIQAKYFHLECDRFLDDSDDWAAQHKFNNVRWLGDLYWNENVTQRAEIPPGQVEPFAFAIQTARRNLKCTIETTYVEVEVACSTYDACAAVRIRRSRLAHPPAAHTLLGPLIGFKNTPWEYSLTAMYVGAEPIDAFRGDDEDSVANGSAEWGMTIFSRRYLDDPEYILGVEDGTSLVADDASLITHLSQVLNAHWATMNGKRSLMGNFDIFTSRPNVNLSWYHQDQDDIQNMDARAQNHAFILARTWLTTGTRRSNVEVFKAHFGWVIALIVSSTVLIVASLVPFYLRTFLPHGPDVLMNFSSLAARDNPYVAIPGTGTYLDAADRSRLLKDVRIRFGDVEEGGEIGRLAIGRADGDVAPLRKGRKYA